MKPATKGQMVEIVNQLGNGGIDFDAAQAIIGHTPVERVAQARRLYELGFGDILGCETFEKYLDATGRDSFGPVPLIPQWPKEQRRHFGAGNIWLVDGRVAEKIGLKGYCRLLGVDYLEHDCLFERLDPERAKSGIRWMIGQDGYRNRNRKPADVRQSLARFEVGMDAVEGAAVYAQDPNVIRNHHLDLLGSLQTSPVRIGYIGFVDGGVELYRRETDANPYCGAATRGE